MRFSSKLYIQQDTLSLNEKLCATFFVNEILIYLNSTSDSSEKKKNVHLKRFGFEYLCV